MGNLGNGLYQLLYMSEGVSGMDGFCGMYPLGLIQNRRLDPPFQESDVKKAFFEMYPTKSPASDGFRAHFFQRKWEVCGEEVTEAVMRVLRGQDDPRSINKTFIVLIP
jgi:hypothetical protein